MLSSVHPASNMMSGKKQRGVLHCHGQGVLRRFHASMQSALEDGHYTFHRWGERISVEAMLCFALSCLLRHADMCACTICRQEKNGAASHTVTDKGCCRDFTHPCRVPAFPSTSKTAQDRLRPTWLKTDANKDERLIDPFRYWTVEYGKGGMFWSYGGSGMFLSAGLLESVQQGSGGAGWERCTEMFGIGYDTDVQVCYLFLN